MTADTESTITALTEPPTDAWRTCKHVSQPAAFLGGSPATTGQLKTNLLQRAGTQAVQTVEQREDVKQAEDVDPLKSFHL